MKKIIMTFILKMEDPNFRIRMNPLNSIHKLKKTIPYIFLIFSSYIAMER